MYSVRKSYTQVSILTCMYRRNSIFSHSKQRLAKQSTSYFMKAQVLNGCTIVAFVPRNDGAKSDSPSFLPYAIRRDSDGEVFQIGDPWYSKDGPCSTGVVPHGKITGFEMLNGNVYIEHTWSGVGFSIYGIEKGTQQLPSKFQINQVVNLNFGSNIRAQHATVRGVHFFKSGIKYDLVLWLGDGSVDNPEYETRVYNVEEKYLSAV